MIINGRYRVIGTLRQSQSSRTYLAEDIRMPSNRRCVLNELTPKLDNTENIELVQQRFDREAINLEKLGESHLQIPRLYAFFRNGPFFYLVWQWVEGRNISSIVDLQGKLSEDLVVLILISVLKVLGFVHGKGIIHQNLSPESIIFPVGNKQPMPVLTEFGSVLSAVGTLPDNQYCSHTSRSPNSELPNWMRESIRPDSDLYSLGLIAVYMLTGGEHPRAKEGTNEIDITSLMRSLGGLIHSDLYNIINQAIQPKPIDRFYDAEKMMNALLALNATNTSHEPQLTRLTLEDSTNPRTATRQRASIESTQTLSSRKTSPIKEPIDVFISYSHRDEELKDELYIHLANLIRQGKIRPWQDRAIEAGTAWDNEIKARLEAARIILLLITPRFVASEYCFDREMRRAMERHAKGEVRVIPIVMKYCDWQDMPFSKLQMLPKDAKPVTAWGDQDEALLNVVQGIRKAIRSLSQR